MYSRLPVWEKDTRSVQENMVLHGSFLVFSRTYFDHFDGFYDRTFLYLIITLSACASSSIEPRPCNCRLQILCAQKQIFANAYIFLTPEEKNDFQIKRVNIVDLLRFCDFKCIEIVFDTPFPQRTTNPFDVPNRHRCAFS